MLVVILLLVLASLVVIQFGPWQARRLSEGARQMEAVLRMARAEASNRQLRLQLNFDPQSGDLMMLWEPKPLENPGQFQPFTSASWDAEIPRTDVRIRRCELTGADAFATLATNYSAAPADAQNPLQAVTFYPDGHCDSAVLELVSTDAADGRVVILQLDGLNGAVTTNMLSAEEAQEHRAGATP